MSKELIDRIFSSLFDELKRINKFERIELPVGIASAALLGYFAFGNFAGAGLAALVVWQIRGSAYALRKREIRRELDKHTLEYPEDASRALERQKQVEDMERAAREASR